MIITDLTMFSPIQLLSAYRSRCDTSLSISRSLDTEDRQPGSWPENDAIQSSCTVVHTVCPHCWNGLHLIQEIQRECNKVVDSDVTSPGWSFVIDQWRSMWLSLVLMDGRSVHCTMFGHYTDQEGSPIDYG